MSRILHAKMTYDYTFELELIDYVMQHILL
jgi:hypothetical protein